MMTMASSPGLPSLSLSVTTVSTPFLFSPRFLPHFSKFKGKWGGGFMVLRANCLPGSTPEAESAEDGAEQTSSSSSSSVDISSYNWCAGLGGLGFLETSYLTYLKLSDSEVFCPVAGGTCGDILNSDYSVVFGVPLSLFGMIAYGFVLVLSLRLAGRNLPFGISESDGCLALLLTTTSMATASAYFLYILNTKFVGASCSYCVASAILSFSLFFITLKDLGLQELRKVLALPLCTAAIVLAVLGTSYSSAQPASSSSSDIDLPFYATEITTESSPLAISLARHLHSIGAKMFGAFWCSHCLEQKEMFGHEAAKLLDYVECFPDGYRKGVKIAKVCADARIDGFPAWVINGQVLNGEQELSELARVSGFDADKPGQP
ncbi:ribosome biosynthesis protein lto1 [Ancistrocladus abbreviatus]